jgi:hypothetical protein
VAFAVVGALNGLKLSFPDEQKPKHKELAKVKKSLLHEKD